MARLRDFEISILDIIELLDKVELDRAGDE
jgi:hypothetical protein